MSARTDPCGGYQATDIPTATRWQKEFFENGAAAFQQRGRKNHQPEQERIAYLEKKIQTKDEVLAELMAEHVALKKSWGTLTRVWVPHDTRDQIVDFVRRWSEKTEISAGQFIHWLGVTTSKFCDWRERYGCVNEHNGWVPRDFWLEEWEKQAIIAFHLKNPLEGYRRLTFMMLDADVVAVSPASVWRVLKQAGLLSRWKAKPSRKGAASSSRSSRINIGTSMFPTSTSAGLSIICAAFWMGTVVPSCIRTRQGKVPAGKAAHHLGQRAAVHRSRFQGVYSNLWHDACPNFSLLSPIELENRALAQIAKERVHPARNTAFAGRCAASGTSLRRALQPRPLEQCHRLCHADGYAGRTPAGDSGRPRSEIGSGERTPEESPPASRVIDETDYFTSICTVNSACSKSRDQLIIECSRAKLTD